MHSTLIACSLCGRRQRPRKSRAERTSTHLQVMPDGNKEEDGPDVEQPPACSAQRHVQVAHQPLQPGAAGA